MMGSVYKAVVGFLAGLKALPCHGENMILHRPKPYVGDTQYIVIKINYIDL